MRQKNNHWKELASNVKWCKMCEELRKIIKPSGEENYWWKNFMSQTECFIRQNIFPVKLVGSYIRRRNVDYGHKWKSIAGQSPSKKKKFIEQLNILSDLLNKKKCFTQFFFSQCTFNVYVLCCEQKKIVWKLSKILNRCLKDPIINYVIHQKILLIKILINGT